jgi:hypothetical protein
MAVAALGSELEPVGIVLPPIPVAGLAGLGRSPDHSPDVAAVALDEPVLSRQREAGVVVSENHPHPVRLLLLGLRREGRKTEKRRGEDR